MRMVRRFSKAFTLVELVVVIAIVGILAAIAIPRFIDIRSEAYFAQRDGIVGSVRAGILTVATHNQVKGGSGTFPPELETQWNSIGAGTDGTSATTCNDSSATTPCFQLVIPGGYVDTNWASTGTGKVYTFTAPVGGSTATYTYTPGDGTFR